MFIRSVLGRVGIGYTAEDKLERHISLNMCTVVNSKINK
jgi:hypothetical protein